MRELSKAPKVLSGCGKQHLIPGGTQAPQPKPVELQNALHVSCKVAVRSGGRRGGSSVAWVRRATMAAAFRTVAPDGSLIAWTAKPSFRKCAARSSAAA